MLVGGVVMVALLAIGVMFASIRIQELNATPTLAFPASPIRVVPTIDPAPLPDPDLPRLERLP
jgi:hypothetical protein